MHADVVDLLMSMTLACVCALITIVFRSKQTTLIHSFTHLFYRTTTNTTLPLNEAHILLLFKSRAYTHLFVQC